MREMGPDLAGAEEAAGAGAAATRKGRAAARRLVENCILDKVSEV